MDCLLCSYSQRVLNHHRQLNGRFVTFGHQTCHSSNALKTKYMCFGIPFFFQMIILFLLFYQLLTRDYKALLTIVSTLLVRNWFIVYMQQQPCTYTGTYVVLVAKSGPLQGQLASLRCTRQFPLSVYCILYISQNLETRLYYHTSMYTYRTISASQYRRMRALKFHAVEWESSISFLGAFTCSCLLPTGLSAALLPPCLLSHNSGICYSLV